MATTRPDRPRYYMGIALAVRERANCLGSRVGAVVVLDDRVVATGYNGTPAGFPNCDEGGCLRCGQRERFASGAGYDVCVCVHAEQNALLSAARFGIALEGAELYSTKRPCFNCTKELLQAGIRKVWYLEEWSHPDERLREMYEALQAHISHGLERVTMGGAPPAPAAPAPAPPDLRAAMLGDA